MAGQLVDLAAPVSPAEMVAASCLAHLGAGEGAQVMSYVTNALLTYSVLESSECIDDVNRCLDVDHTPGQRFGPDIAEQEDPAIVSVIGGYKAFEAVLHMGAFNYRSARQLLDAVRLANWQYPDQVQLLVKGEESPRFRSFGLDDDPDPDHLTNEDLDLLERLDHREIRRGHPDVKRVLAKRDRLAPT